MGGLTTSRCTKISSCDSFASEVDVDLRLLLSRRSEPRATTLRTLLTLLVWVPKLDVLGRVVAAWEPPLPDWFSDARARVVMRTLRAGRVPTRTAVVVKRGVVRVGSFDFLWPIV